MKALQRLEHEMSLITRKELSGYFLLVKDIRDFARAHSIHSSVRGSAAGSLVTCLLLGGVDPIEATETLPELKNTPLKEEREMIEASARISGLPFQLSVHLGGMITAPKDISAWVPVDMSNKEFPVAQQEKTRREFIPG